jgi:signal transduction histidine kinase
LIVLPLWCDASGAEIVIAANPARVPDGLRLVEDSTLHSRLISAVQLLHSREHQRREADKQLAQERALAQERERYAEAMRQLERQQRNRTRASNTMLSTLLHENPLQHLAKLADKLRQAQTQEELDTTAFLAMTIQECVTIDQEIRDVIRNLRPFGVGQRIEQAIEQAVMEWERTYSKPTFSYDAVRVSLPLSDEQRHAIMRVIRQAVENAIEHAEASVIRIEATQQGQCFVVDVIDDGKDLHTTISVLIVMASACCSCTISLKRSMASSLSVANLVLDAM